MGVCCQAALLAPIVLLPTLHQASLVKRQSADHDPIMANNRLLLCGLLTGLANNLAVRIE